MSPRRKRGVTQDRFRIRVCMLRILEDHPRIQQVTKTSLAQSITASLSSEFTTRDATRRALSKTT